MNWNLIIIKMWWTQQRAMLNTYNVVVVLTQLLSFLDDDIN